MSVPLFFFKVTFLLFFLFKKNVTHAQILSNKKIKGKLFFRVFFLYFLTSMDTSKSIPLFTNVTINVSAPIKTTFSFPPFHPLAISFFHSTIFHIVENKRKQFLLPFIKNNHFYYPVQYFIYLHNIHT